MAILDDIAVAIRGAAYRITGHASKEMLDDDLHESELITSTVEGELVEDYPSAFPFPACLVLGALSDGSAIHAVWAYDTTTCYAVLVTAYRPDPSRWTPDFRVRIKK